MRSGDEPSHARSPLGLRLALAGLGLACAVALVAIGLASGGVPWLLSGVLLAVIAVTDLVVIVIRIRQGPHFQPGKDVPPYRPVPPERVPGRPGRPTAERVRQRRYFALMGTCLGLLLVAWLVVRLYSTTATVVLSLIAMVIPPVAAIVANANTGYGPDQQSDRAERSIPRERSGPGRADPPSPGRR